MDACGRAAVLLRFGAGWRLALLVDALVLDVSRDAPWMPPPALHAAEKGRAIFKRRDRKPIDRAYKNLYNSGHARKTKAAAVPGQCP